MSGCPFNKTWYHKVYGEQGLKEIENFPILCSGVTGGPSQAVFSYLEAMCSEILRVGSRMVHLNGYDQAVHNHLLRQGPLTEHITLCGEDSSDLVTMHYACLNELQILEDGLMRKNGSVISIVHQYDRHSSLEEAINKK